MTSTQAILLIVSANAVLAALPAYIARTKNRRWYVWYLISAFSSFVAGTTITASLPSVGSTATPSVSRNKLLRNILFSIGIYLVILIIGTVISYYKIQQYNSIIFHVSIASGFLFSLIVTQIPISQLTLYVSKNYLNRFDFYLIVTALLSLCITIVFGALWANEAWGQYWSWDPKETWQVIGLIMGAIALIATLKLRIFVTPDNKRNFIIFLTGLLWLAVNWIGYFAIKLLLSGLQPYGGQ